MVTIDLVFEVWHYEQAERYALGDRISHIVGMGAVSADFDAAFAGEEQAYLRLRGMCVGHALVVSCTP